MARRSEFEPVKTASKELVKEAIWYSMTRFEQGEKKSICLFTTRRSGGTFLMEMIAANKGVRSIGQPDTIYSASAWQIRHLPVVDRGELISLDEDTEQGLESYFTKILSGRLQVNAPWRFWRNDFNFRSDRLVLKIGGAKALIDWFDQTFPVSIVYSTRHPIPTALSIIRNGWGLTAPAYLSNRTFVDEYLGEEVLGHCRDVLARGTLLEKHVLNWGLENLVPARLLPERPHWLYVSYEESTLVPEQTVQKLASALELKDTARMLDKVRIPSRTSGLSTRRTRQLIKQGAAESLVSKWRTEISIAEERRCFEILAPLGVSLYGQGEDSPTASRDVSP
jgi:hypothetical protein